MRPLLYFSAILLAGFNANAQNIELSAGITGNLYNYVGSATNDPVYSYGLTYSRTLSAGYGAAAQLNFVAKNGFIFGLQTGYDRVFNAQTTDYVINFASVDFVGNVNFGRYDFRGLTTPSQGYVYSELEMINLNPYAGYRLKRKNISIDFIAGTEVAYNVNNKFLGTVFGQQSGSFNPEQPTDYRLKGGVSVRYKRLRADIAYAHGVTNFLKGQTYIGPYAREKFPASAYSQLIKLGLTYRIF